jgi:hypothetical protein
MDCRVTPLCGGPAMTMLVVRRQRRRHATIVITGPARSAESR